MRVTSGFAAAAMLAALAQPAFATCVYRAAVKTCHDDPKSWTSAVGPEKEAPAENPAPSVKTIVLEPSASIDNAWVMRPESGAGAAAPGVIQVAVPACEPGVNC
jgi:hypothetical protein